MVSYMEFGISVNCVLDTDFSSRTCWVLPISVWANAAGGNRTVLGLFLADRAVETTNFQGWRNDFVRIGIAYFPLMDMPNLQEDKVKLVRLS